MAARANDADAPQSRAAAPVLGLDDLVAAELDPVRQRLELLLADARELGLGLREYGQDGDARVAADDGDPELGRVSRLAEDLGGKGLGADDV